MTSLMSGRIIKMSISGGETDYRLSRRFPAFLTGRLLVVLSTLLISLTRFQLVMTSSADALTDDPPLEYYVLEELPAGRIIGNLIANSRLSTRYSTTVLAVLRFAYISL